MVLDAPAVTADSTVFDALRATLDPAARDAPMVALVSAVLGAHAAETAQCNSQNSDAALDPAHADTRGLSLKVKHDSAALARTRSSSTRRRPTRTRPTQLCALLSTISPTTFTSSLATPPSSSKTTTSAGSTRLLSWAQRSSASAALAARLLLPFLLLLFCFCCTLGLHDGLVSKKVMGLVERITFLYIVI